MTSLKMLVLPALLAAALAAPASASDGFLFGQGGMSCRQVLKIVLKYRACATASSTDSACATDAQNINRIFEYEAGFVAALKATHRIQDEQYATLINDRVVDVSSLNDFCFKYQKPDGSEIDEKYFFDDLSSLAKWLLSPCTSRPMYETISAGDT